MRSISCNVRIVELVFAADAVRYAFLNFFFSHGNPEFSAHSRLLNRDWCSVLQHTLRMESNWQRTRITKTCRLTIRKRWPNVFRDANQGSLAKYLEGFAHTIAVMQTEEALQRFAYEQAEDLSRDGVVYFETRFAPIFHTRRGLTHQQVVSAVLKGLDRGRKDFGVHCGLIICAMRNMNTSLEMAELAVDFRERGSGGIRPGRRRRRLSSEETCRRLSLHPTRKFQHHGPRRGGLREGIDLAGDPVLRRPPHRARNQAHR